VKYRDLLPEELAALRIFAAENGAKWKEVLAMKYWYNARVYRAKDGKEYPILHALRNNLGPKWLDGYKLPKEPGAGNYREFEELPANWAKPIWKGGKVVNEAEPYKWSGDGDPPKIGAKVNVSVNGIGEGKVTSYFVEYGWLGVMVRPKKAPDWYIKQNGRYALAHIFGNELKAEAEAK